MSITIVTALKNGEKTIKNLINSLNNQTNKNFKWLIIDSVSDDNSIFLINSNTLIDFKIIQTKDFSIYHALNIALENIDTEYYAVAGCDDQFEYNFIENFNKVCTKKFDLILGNILINNKLTSPKIKSTFLNPANVHHSIGLIIKTNLHNKFGIYSNLYPIMADKYFIAKILTYKNSTLYIDPNTFGTYSISGFSSINSHAHICDLYKIQISQNYNSFIQSIILFLRLLKLNIFNIFR